MLYCYFFLYKEWTLNFKKGKHMNLLILFHKKIFHMSFIKKFGAIFFIIFWFLLISHLISQLSIFPNDMGPINFEILFIYMILSWLYSSIFNFIDNIFLPNIKIAIIWNIILVIALIIQSYLYYNTEVDYLAINTWLAALTTYESIVKSNYGLPITIAIFLMAYSSVRLYLRKK